MNQSTLFLSAVSVVDHAYIDQRGNVVGGSFQPSFLVSGEVDPVEQVVVDFSTIKKDIKAIIDHKEIGFDHKLWVINGFSNCTYEIISSESGDERIHIITPTTNISVPRNAVTLIDNLNTTVYTTEAVGFAFAELVQTELRKQYPAVNIEVECINTTEAHFTLAADSATLLFTYSHGLKDSTSWGCQNIAHGHLSYLQLEAHPDATIENDQDISRLMDLIQSDINDALFVNVENISRNEGPWMTVSYETGRGRFTAVYNTEAYNVRVLETETTVEHLVDYVTEKYRQQLTNARVSRVWMSEGLSKGSVAVV